MLRAWQAILPRSRRPIHLDRHHRTPPSNPPPHAPPSRGEALRPTDFSHRLRDAKSLVSYCAGLVRRLNTTRMELKSCDIEHRYSPTQFSRRACPPCWHAKVCGTSHGGQARRRNGDALEPCAVIPGSPIFRRAARFDKVRRYESPTSERCQGNGFTPHSPPAGNYSGIGNCRG
jgi:hypothetical protein